MSYTHNSKLCRCPPPALFKSAEWTGSVVPAKNAVLDTFCLSQLESSGLDSSLISQHLRRLLITTDTALVEKTWIINDQKNFAECLGAGGVVVET
ncbi:hypothetical protein BaRGS_00015998 [Batillaria attramentaria]|uniref:Uncharacterized protein n=1 Tax=Batillaria attramentaria TaxID=370345 RepID=A0ABD0L0F1_9CAEN